MLTLVVLTPIFSVKFGVKALKVSDKGHFYGVWCNDLNSFRGASLDVEVGLGEPLQDLGQAAHRVAYTECSPR